MRKFLSVILTTIMVFSLASVAMAETAPEAAVQSKAPQTITVSGSGESLVAADAAIISLGVSARDKDVLKAQAKVNEAIADIRSALLEAGIAETDINTDYINIYAMYDYGYGDGEEVLAAYNANSTLAIRTEDMEKVGEIIDIAFGAGANMLNGISFSATDTEEAEAEALKKAVADAKGKAEVLAEAAGLTITSIQSINEGGTYSFDRGVANNFSFFKEEAAMDAAGTVVQAAKLTVSTDITITYIAE